MTNLTPAQPAYIFTRRTARSLNFHCATGHRPLNLKRGKATRIQFKEVTSLNTHHEDLNAARVLMTCTRETTDRRTLAPDLPAAARRFATTPWGRHYAVTLCPGSAAFKECLQIRRRAQVTPSTDGRLRRLYEGWIGYDPREDDPVGYDPAEVLRTLREYREERRQAAGS